MEKIYRSATDLSANNDSRIIEGVAVSFNTWSRDLGGFTEIIRSGAITQELIDNSDVVMCVNHDENKMVARSRNGKGTLLLELREDGLHFMFEAPSTQLGDELLYNVRNGNLFECSFAFSIDGKDAGSEKWYRTDSNELKREIIKINGLYDCSIVTHAAYPATSCSARAAEVKANIEEIDKALDVTLNEINNL
jgi:HK97 family phage prohead protease